MPAAHWRQIDAASAAVSLIGAHNMVWNPNFGGPTCTLVDKKNPARGGANLLRMSGRVLNLRRILYIRSNAARA